MDACQRLPTPPCLGPPCRNERVAPELQPYNATLVTEISELCATLEQIILGLSEPRQQISREALVMDLSRVQYLLRAYHRTRLRKIEKHALHYCDGEPMELMSDKEREWALNYVLMWGRHMTQSVTRHLPDEFNDLRRCASQRHRPVTTEASGRCDTALSLAANGGADRTAT